jgi:arylsulfatase A-like enzyme
MSPTLQQVHGHTRVLPPRPIRGKQHHLLTIWLDDPPPMRWSEPVYARWHQYIGKVATERQRLYGSTPFMNSLVRRGLLYGRVYTAPVCSPGRASLLTGEHPYDHGLGSVVNSQNLGNPMAGGMRQFRDAGFDSGTLIVDALATAPQRPVCGFVGKMHTSLDAIDFGDGLEFSIMDRASESSNGRMGDWDYRCVIINNHNTRPVPSVGHPGPQPAGVNNTGNPGQGSYYFFRTRLGRQEYNVGGIPAPSVAQGRQNNSNGTYSDLWWGDRVVDFWRGLPRGERGYCHLSVNTTHAPFDYPPESLTRTPGYYREGTIFRRCLAKIEALDSALCRMYGRIPKQIRDNLVIVLGSDNGIDTPWLRSALGLGSGAENTPLNMGPHMVIANQGRTKSSIYRYGIGGQLFAFGPGVAAGKVFRGMVNAPVDINATVQDYFGVPSIAGSGISLRPTWDGTRTMTGWTRQSSWNAYWSPMGSPDPADHAVLAPAAQWLTATGYVVGNIRFNTNSDGERLNYRCITNHTSGSTTEPGVGAVWTTAWVKVGERALVFHRVVQTADATGEPLGVYKLIRHLYPSGADLEDWDQLYHTHDIDGQPVDPNEQTNVVATRPDTYELLVDEMEAEQGGFA